LTSAAVSGIRIEMSRAATTIGLRLTAGAPVIVPPAREPRKRKMPSATTAMTAPMIVKGRPVIAGILRPG